MRRVPLKLRIAAAFRGHLSLGYHELMSVVFPPEQYPRAYRYQANGGPPGCAMAFGRALRELGATWTGMGSERRVYKTSAIQKLQEEMREAGEVR